MLNCFFSSFSYLTGNTVSSNYDERSWPKIMNRSRCPCSVFYFSPLSFKFEYPYRFYLESPFLYLTKTISAGAEFHVERWTDRRHKVNICFSHLVERTKNSFYVCFIKSHKRISYSFENVWHNLTPCLNNYVFWQYVTFYQQKP
jgi:hypothetical protein